jgi:hypothetical protein
MVARVVHSGGERATATMGPPTGSHTVSVAVTPNYASARPVGPASSLQELLNRVMQSPIGARIVQAYANYGGLPNIHLAAPGELAKGINGQYNRETNSVAINASLLQQDPQQAAITLAHELFHGLDNVSGMANRISASFDLATAHTTMEARAYAVASRVQRELGYAQDAVGGVGGPSQAAYGAADLTGAYANAYRTVKAKGL